MTQAQQPEALRLAHTLIGGKLIDDSTEWAETQRHAAIDAAMAAHARNKKRNRAMNAEQTIDTAKSLQRVQNYLERLEVAKGYHKECIHAFIDKDGAEIPLLATDLKAILQQVAATHPTQQGLDARDAAFEAVRKAFCNLQRYSFWLDSRGNVRRCADRSGNWVEFEAAHTLFEPQSVDAALAAKANQGEAQQ